MIIRPSLSACIITKNEKYNLRNMLENIKDIADEIVIVDEHSTDGTIDILKEYNVKTFNGKLNNNWGALRNKAIENATMDWILIIDADELLEPLLHQALNKNRKSDPNHLLNYCENNGYDAVVLRRKNYLDNIFQPQLYPDRTIRLFKNNKIIKYSGFIHEQIIDYTKRLESEYNIIHKKSFEKQKRQNARYTNIDNIVNRNRKN